MLSAVLADFGGSIPASEVAPRTAAVTATKAPQRPASGSLGGYAHVSERVLKYLLHRDVKLNQYVAESMLNMTTRGTARIDCQIGLDLVPNPHAANLRITMTGHATMDDARSSMRRIAIYSSSQTQISGYKDVFFSSQGFALAPARANCRTSIQIHDIDARRRLIERIAWRRAARMHPQAEQSAAGRAARRAEQQLEAETGKPLGQLHHEYIRDVYRPLARDGAFPDARFATTDGHLAIRLFSRAAPSERGDAPAGSPPAPAYDLAVCLKDSYLNELVAPWVGGRTLTDRHFADVMLTLTGKTPRPLWVHERSEPWSVTAAARRPVIASFAGDVASVTFHIDGATRGERRLDRPLAISAKYSLEATPDGPRLIRLGELAVDFTDGDSIDPAVQQSPEPEEAEFKQFLKRKFGGVFLAELYFDGLMPPAGGSWGKLRSLELKQLTSRDGWLALGYERPAPAAKTEIAVRQNKR